MPQPIAIAPTSDLPEHGDRLTVEIDGQPIAIFNVNGEYLCVDDICTHDDGPLVEGDLDGHTIECPRHGARFDLHTGKALTFPAVTGITTYPVTIENGQITIEFPD